jgi:membrane-associated phospholipid phosphatase
LILIHALRRFGRRALPVALYPLGVWCSAVYLNHHYLIDILLAVIYVVAADALVGFVLFPRVFERGPLRRLLAWRTEPPNSVPKGEPEAIAAR